MADQTNSCKYIRNVYGAPGPYLVEGKFGTGAAAPIDQFELLELTGNTNTEWVPMDSDFAASKNVAVSNGRRISGDLAGYQPIIVPRPGDIFEVTLDAAAAPAPGTALYWSADGKLTPTAGSNIMAYTVDDSAIPEQGSQSVSPSLDAGTTLRSKPTVRCMFVAAVSYFAALQR